MLPSPQVSDNRVFSPSTCSARPIPCPSLCPICVPTPCPSPCPILCPYTVSSHTFYSDGPAASCTDHRMVTAGWAARTGPSWTVKMGETPHHLPPDPAGGPERVESRFLIPNARVQHQSLCLNTSHNNWLVTPRMSICITESIKSVLGPLQIMSSWGLTKSGNSDFSV